jgi:DNA-binding transcriptional MerR regulator
VLLVGALRRERDLGLERLGEKGLVAGAQGLAVVGGDLAQHAANSEAEERGRQESALWEFRTDHVRAARWREGKMARVESIVNIKSRHIVCPEEKATSMSVRQTVKAVGPPTRKQSELTYALGAVCRITGLTPDALRVWERRYGAVVPLRTPKGTRRYRAADIARLQLLRAAIEAGQRIGSIAHLDDAELGRIAAQAAAALPAEPLARALAAIQALDSAAAERAIADQLVALGAVRFAREFAIPLLQGVGERWIDGRLCVAAEHLASALLRSLLGAALRPAPRAHGAPVILFATPPGERHELGLLISALVAMGAGANPLYLGTELPAPELARAVELSGAQTVVLAITKNAGKHAEREIRVARKALESDVEIWIGGGAARALGAPTGVRVFTDLDDFERHVQRLREKSARRPIAKEAARSRGGRPWRRSRSAK